ncbi:hypothetical protein IP92_01911 [Pseudoduganella flava]|uniref:Uncharacterized protein n=1 Tax=Pseudoduganella flava TaxID=871742 RepID=A0A562PVS7_9BURK|nr:hypothetical protein [Pseudoduganella flava]QGZ39620.1 hypothetical protein GO485_11560 [Pseudoduganella flava]TWI48519.1 hypothetical protein IP92_01911 [Pseudoduganella flava]
MRQLETDLILRFHTALHAQFSRRQGGTLAGTALGGQDRALADYLLAANARFALIEFKAAAAAIATEDDKPLRHRLCRALGTCRQSAALARDIHYLAWGSHAERNVPGFGMQTVEDIVVTPYAGKVCPLLDEAYPAPAQTEEPSERFIRRFLGSRTAGGSARRFKAYLELLYGIAGGCTASELKRFEGFVYVYVAGAVLHEVRFHGLDHLLELTLGRSPERAPERLTEREPERKQTRERDGPELSM